MFIGVSQKKITPDSDVNIFKAQFKDSIRDRVIDDLHVRTICLKHDKAILIINLDLIWVSRKFSDSMREWVEKAFRIPRSNIMISATHTHSSPQIRENIIDGGTLYKNYVSFLDERVKSSVSEAIQSLKSGHIRYSTGEISCSINRRRSIVDLEQLKKGKIKKKIANRPNFKGSNDNKFIALWVFDKGEKPLAVLLNFACHASIFKCAAVSSDFPAYVARQLSDRFGPEFVTFYLQGFSGNIRPRLISKSSFDLYKPLNSLFNRIFDPIHFRKNNNKNDLVKFGQQIVHDLLSQARQNDFNPCFSGKEKEITLTCQNNRTKQYFDRLAKSPDRILSDYGGFISKNYDKVYERRFLIQRIFLSKKIAILAMEGEIFTEYSFWMRSYYEKDGFLILPVGCANGMVGYIPDKKGLIEGGYEPERSIILFGLPDKFSIAIERQIKTHVAQLMEY